MAVLRGAIHGQTLLEQLETIARSSLSPIENEIRVSVESAKGGHGAQRFEQLFGTVATRNSYEDGGQVEVVFFGHFTVAPVDGRRILKVEKL